MLPIIIMLGIVIVVLLCLIPDQPKKKPITKEEKAVKIAAANLEKAQRILKAKQDKKKLDEEFEEIKQKINALEGNKNFEKLNNQ